MSFWQKGPSWAGSLTRVEPKQSHPPPLSGRSRSRKRRRQRSWRKSIRFRATLRWRPFWRLLGVIYPKSWTRPNWVGGFRSNQPNREHMAKSYWLAFCPRHIWPSLRRYWPWDDTGCDWKLCAMSFRQPAAGKNRGTVVDWLDLWWVLFLFCIYISKLWAVL